MTQLTSNEFKCLDCGSHYSRPMAFVDAERAAHGCPKCGSPARRKQRRWLHWARDFVILLNTQ